MSKMRIDGGRGLAPLDSRRRYAFGSAPLPKFSGDPEGISAFQAGMYTLSYANQILTEPRGGTRLCGNWSPMGRFDGEFGDGAQTYTGTARVRYAW